MPSSRFYVAGLGASAGGLGALRAFFAAVPAKSGAAFVVIQHLAPDYRSQMVELLATHTPATILQIEDGMNVERDHVYMSPPGKCVKIFRGKLFLLDPEKRSPHLPIDQFFRSLAEDCGELAIAIALSGTGSDGTLGVRAIKEAGGTVMVQDAASAQFSGLPDSAGATGLADYTLPPAEMARELLRFIRHPLVAPVKSAAFHVNEVTMHKIVSLIHEQTGIDFSGYKQSTVIRRIQRRIGITQLANTAEYLEFLRQSPPEIAALGRDLLINVTKFFRDAEVFAYLRDKILPAMLDEAAPRKALRIWVPGCATGEEAYSICMLVQDLLSARGEKWDVKIFATDVDKGSIEMAGRGLYPKSVAADVDPALLGRYFAEESGGLRIATKIREQIVFACQNILRDPPFTKVDLVSCRNMLIYLRGESQNKTMALLHFALQPNGYLLLGTSETIGDREHAFEVLNAKLRIFKKRVDSGPAIAGALDALLRATGASKSLAETAAIETSSSATKGDVQIWETIGARLLTEFKTTCLVLNAQHEMIYSFGEPNRFLTVCRGEASLDVLKLVPRSLSFALSGALRRAMKEQHTVRYRGVRLAGKAGAIDLAVEPLTKNSDSSGMSLVFLRHTGAAAGAAKSSTASHGRLSDLEDDLEQMKEDLQAASQDKKIAQEELQATNEELLAGNEELQSGNEELEAVNEE